MNQNQDELQAAINDITNAASAGGAVDMAAMTADPTGGAASAADDIVAQIQNKVAAESAATAATAPAIEPIKVEEIVEAPVNMPAAEPKMEIEGAGALTNEPKTYTTIDPERSIYGDPDLDRVKIGALNEIRPILESADISPEKKFLIYKDIIELTEDKSCIELAFNASCKIQDEKMRAEALLYIIEVIDDLGIKMEADKAGK